MARNLFAIAVLCGALAVAAGLELRRAGPSSGGLPPGIPVNDAHSREFSFQNQPPAGLGFGDAMSREFSFQNDISAALDFTDAVSREFSFENQPPSAVAFEDAISREFSFQNEISVTLDFTNAASREFSFQNQSAIALSLSNAVSREFSFENEQVVVLRFTDAGSREFSFQNESGTGLEFTGAGSREFSFQNESASSLVFSAACSREFSFQNSAAPTFALSGAASREFSYYRVLGDLSVTAVAIGPDPGAGMAGQPFEVSWTVTNVSGTPADGPWLDRVFTSRDPVLGDGNDALLGQAAFAAGAELGPGESYQRVRAFLWPTTPGDYWVFVESYLEDDPNHANDSRVSAGPIVISPAPMPDLIVTEVIPPTDLLLSGATTQITYTVMNQGDAATDVTYWTDLIVLTVDEALIDPPPWLFNETILRAEPNPQFLLPGESYTETVEVALPHDIEGPFHVAVYADARGDGPKGAVFRVRESDEQNNFTFSAPFVIGLEIQPDLQVFDEEIDFNDIAFAGLDFTVDWIDRNEGEGPTNGGQWSDAVYLSLYEDAVIVPADIWLGTVNRNGPVLNPGGFDAARTLTQRIPPCTSDGFYYVKALVDSTDQISEFGLESNNIGVSFDSVYVVQLPPIDLLPSNISAAPVGGTDFIPGHLFNVTWSVENIGVPPDQYPESWQDAIFLSTDTVLNRQTDVLLGSFAHGTTTDAEGRVVLPPYTKTRSVRLPNDTTAGSRYLFVVVDVNNTLCEGFEGGEGNNEMLSAAIPVVFRPTDLDIAVNFDDSHLLPTSGAAAQTLVLSWQIVNAGQAVTPVSSWTDSVWFSTDTTIGGGDAQLISFTRLTELQSGASYIVEQTATVPLWAPGSYYLIFKTDTGNYVYEQSPGENNNTVIAPLVVTGAASDLIVTSVQPPDAGQAGLPIHVEWTVQNQGTLRTNAAAWTDCVYVSPRIRLDSNAVLLGCRTRSGHMDSGGTYLLAGDFTLPANLSGLYQIIVKTDHNGNVFETNENNNELAHPVLMNVAGLLPANLVMGPVAAADAAISGQTLSVTWQVSNLGEGPTNTGNWRDAVYLSRDQFLDRDWDDYLGNTQHNGPLDIGQSYNATQAFSIPFGLNGPYFVFVLADSNNNVSEAGHEDDNEGHDAVPTEIAIPPPSDLVVVEGQITPPASAMLGDDAVFAWQTRNVGGATIQGGWQDSVYLSADDAWDLGDKRVGTFSRSPVTLNPGDVTAMSGTGRIPAALPGDYHVIVRNDVFNQIPESNETNNLGGSVGTFTVSAIPLELGVPYNDSLSAGQEKYFELVAPAGETVRITLDHAGETAWTELYVKFAAVPTPASFDFVYNAPAQPDQEILVPSSQAGVYYILAKAAAGTGGPGGSAMTLLAEVIPFGISAVYPPVVGAGEVTLRLTGSRWDSSTTFQLRHSDTFEEIVPTTVAIQDATIARARFALGAANLGSYDVFCVDANGTGSTILPRALDVEPAGALAPTIELALPAGIRAGQTGIAVIFVTNAGNTDIPYMLFSIWSGANENVDLGVPELGYSIPLLQETVKGVTFFTENLGPGETARVAIVITAPPDYQEPGITLSASARAYSTQGFRDGPLFWWSEKIRHAVLADETTPEVIFLLAQDQQVWWESVSTGFDTFGLHVPDEGDSRSVPPPSWPSVLCGAIAAGVCYYVGGGVWGAIACGGVASAGCHYVAYCIENPEECMNDEPPDLCDSVIPGGTPGRDNAGSGGSPSGDAPPKCGKIPTPRPKDPNEKVGPSGFGGEQFLAAQAPLSYQVHFENTAEATGAAAGVRIADNLDPSLNQHTFRLGDIHFGETTIDMPDNRISYQTTVDLTTAYGVLVEITVGINATAREAFWVLQAIDPATGEPPTNGAVGFLPPNDETGRGQGWVEYTVKPNAESGTGAVIRNKASIVFDVNEPVITNEVYNTLDAGAPASSVSPLPATMTATAFTVTWSGEDDSGGAGVQSYTIYVSDNGGPYAPWAIDETGAGRLFSGAQRNHTYYFYSVARDQVGNTEPAPIDIHGVIVPDALTTVTGLMGDFDGDGDVDLDDFAAFVGCFSGPAEDTEFNPPSVSCQAAFDFDGDTDVDLRDFAAFQAAFSGEAVTGLMGDFDGDGDVDLDDFAAFAGCFSAPAENMGFNIPSVTCRAVFDIDADTDVDLRDFAGFQTAFSGDGAPPQ